MRASAVVALSILAACQPGNGNRADSPAAQAVDTLKPVAATDTLASTTDSSATRPPSTQTKSTSPKLGRDSAFPPPRNLPQLDTVRRRPPA